jgi:hypothetical protein
MLEAVAVDVLFPVGGEGSGGGSGVYMTCLGNTGLLCVGLYASYKHAKNHTKCSSDVAEDKRLLQSGLVIMSALSGVIGWLSLQRADSISTVFHVALWCVYGVAHPLSRTALFLYFMNNVRAAVGSKDTSGRQGGGQCLGTIGAGMAVGAFFAAESLGPLLVMSLVCKVHMSVSSCSILMTVLQCMATSHMGIH